MQIKQSPYEVLGIKSDSAFSEVKKKYIELVKEFSPENNPDKFMQIREAYEVIANPDLLKGCSFHNSGGRLMTTPLRFSLPCS